MLRTVYAETKLNLLSHPKVVLLQEANGVDMGYHHYSHRAAVDMVTFLGGSMHIKLVKHLTSADIPMSLIVDGSTDPRQNHVLIVYIQALERDKPMVYFYKLVALLADESGQAMMDALDAAFQADGDDFVAKFKNNLAGYASDGAPAMAAEGGLKGN